MSLFRRHKAARAAAQADAQPPDDADLGFASAYYRDNRGQIDVFYRPYPAEVPCRTGTKPAIFVKVPTSTLTAFGNRVGVERYLVRAVRRDAHAVLWIRIFAVDPYGTHICAMVPGMTTVTTLAAAEGLSTVPFDLFLDPTDPGTLHWTESWVSSPLLMYYFVIDEADQVAGHLWYHNNPDLGAIVRKHLDEAQQLQATIPADRVDFAAAVAGLRAANQSF